MVRPAPSRFLGNVLRGEIEFDARLEDQPLGNPLVVIAFKPAEHVALLGDERRAFDLEHVGRPPLEPDGRVGPRRRRLEVVPHTGLKVEVRADRAAVECLELRAVDAFAEGAFAFGFYRQTVDVTAEPRLAVPAIAVLAVTDLEFGEVEHDHREVAATFLLHHRHVRAVDLGRREEPSGVAIGRRCGCRRTAGRKVCPRRLRFRLSHPGHSRHDGHGRA